MCEVTVAYANFSFADFAGQLSYIARLIAPGTDRDRRKDVRRLAKLRPKRGSRRIVQRFESVPVSASTERRFLSELVQGRDSSLL